MKKGRSRMRITDETYLEAYREEIGKELLTWLAAYDFSDAGIDLGYNTKASAVYSSNIEGNTVDLNSFMNSMLAAKGFKPKKEIQEIEDLIAAYEFAQSHPLTQENLLAAHRQLSKTLLIRDKRGKYRNDRMGVFDSYGLVYLAIEPEYVAREMDQLFENIRELIGRDLDVEQAFYHAALIHLVFVHIHPFWDGNGRSARLLEKWFLSEKLNSRAWKLQSERYYKEHLEDYYRNINLGINYYELDYRRCIPFLKMLPTSLKAGLPPRDPSHW
jgi:Fic family protein